MIEGGTPSGVIEDAARKQQQSNALTLHRSQQQPSLLQQSLIKRKEARAVKPDFHPQWKLMRVISGHLGWVRSVAVEPANQWFATGAGDRIIKIWDLASGHLKQISCATVLFASQPPRVSIVCVVLGIHTAPAALIAKYGGWIVQDQVIEHNAKTDYRL